MSRLMRMAYGHGGTRLEHTLVSGHHQKPTPTPLRLKLLLLAIWIIVPVLVSLYAIPTTSLPMKTVIDISRLSVRPPPELEKLVIAEAKPVPPVDPQTATPPQPVTAPEPAIEPPRTRPAPVTHIEELKRPSIERAAPAALPDPAEQRPQAVRDRKRTDADADSVPAPRVRRGALPGEAPPEKATVSRSRGASSTEEPAGAERVAVVRRQPAGDTSAAVSASPPQRVARSERSAVPTTESAQRGAAARERARAGSGESGPAAATAGPVRGVSLMSLEICPGSRQQEEAVKAILAIVGSRQSCRNEKGEYQFKGTKRISSFNLMIVPSHGRRLSNRCEELEDAYQCLKHN